MLIAISVPDHKDRERMGEVGAILLQLLHCSTFWDMISPNFISIPVTFIPHSLRKKKSQSKAAGGSTHWYLGVWYGVLHGTCDAIPTCRGVSLSLLRKDGWWCGQGLHGQGPGPRGKLLGPNGGSFEGSIFWRLMWYQENGARWQSLCEVTCFKGTILQLTLPFHVWYLTWEEREFYELFFYT